MSTLPASQHIGLGTYQLGARTYDACCSALELGYRHLDTAALYRNEAAVSRAVASCGIPRQELSVVSKILSQDVAIPTRVLPAVKECLERLDRVDLLLLHAPAGEWLRAWELLLQLHEWPAVGGIGVSNFGINHLEQIQAAGLPLPLWNQVEVSPFLPQAPLVHWCRQHDIQIAAHSPLTKGRRLDHPTLQQIATRHRGTPSQILIAWSLAQGFVVLPRSADPAHQAENLAASRVQLTELDLLQLATMEDGFATHPQHLRQQLLPPTL